MTSSRPHIMVGTPAFGGQLTNLYTSSMLAFQNTCLRRKEVDFSVVVQWGDSLITRARQDIVTRFLDAPEPTHLLFVDGDIGFDPDQVFRLLRFDTDIAAGIYPHKRLDLAKIRALSDKGGNRDGVEAVYSYAYEVDKPSKVDVRNGFVKVSYAGMGFMLIKKPVFLKMMDRYPELNYTNGFISADPLAQSKHRYAFFNCLLDEKTGTYLSEDYSFLRRWSQMGGEIWADLQSKLQHVGPINFRGYFATQFQAPDPR